MKNIDMINRVKSIVAQHDAGQISDSQMLAQVRSVSNRYADNYGLRANTQPLEARMGHAKKTLPRQTARAVV